MFTRYLTAVLSATFEDLAGSRRASRTAGLALAALPRVAARVEAAVRSVSRTLAHAGALGLAACVVLVALAPGLWEIVR